MIIDDIGEILAGKKNEPDISHYMEMLGLFGISTITNNIRMTVTVPTDNSKVSANMYGFGVAGSGIGKSRSFGYQEELLLKKADNYIKEESEKRLELVDPFDLENISKLTSEGVTIAPIFKSATDAGIGALRSIMDVIGLYGVNIAVDEIGSTILKEYDMLSDTLLNAFDKGTVKPNLRRTTGVKAVKNNIPHSTMLFGSPSLLFEGTEAVEKALMSLLEAGWNRRTLYAVVESKTNHYVLNNDGRTKTLIESVSNRLLEVAKKYMEQSICFSDEAAEVYKAYEIQCRMESESFGHYESLKTVYTQNKHWLSLKVSAILAASELSPQIELVHFKRAVEIVDTSFEHMVKVTSRPQKYELLVDYLLEQDTDESEYTLTQKLPFYKDVKNKKQFIELMKGYAFDSNITLMIQDKHNVTFYSAKGREKTDLTKPLSFSYSLDITKDYFTNDDIVWNDFHKIVCSDKRVCYSAHSFTDGYRNRDNGIEGFTLVMLDFDEGVTLDTAKLIFEDYTYLIATTKSHQKDKKGKVEDRFRVILPMKDKLELSAEEYSRFYRALLDDLPIQADKATSDISRFFYSASGQHWYNEGELFDATKYIPNTQEADTYQKEGVKLAKKNINGIGQYILRNESSGRNHQLIKYSLLLMDKGYTHTECKQEVLRLNKQFGSPLAESEIKRTIFKSIERKEEIVVDDYEDDYESEEDDSAFTTVDKD